MYMVAVYNVILEQIFEHFGSCECCSSSRNEQKIPLNHGILQVLGSSSKLNGKCVSFSTIYREISQSLFFSHFFTKVVGMPLQEAVSVLELKFAFTVLPRASGARFCDRKVHDFVTLTQSV